MNLPRMNSRKGRAQCLFVFLAMVSLPLSQTTGDELTFDVDSSTGISSLPASAAISGALGTWTAAFSDPVTISVKIELASETTDFPTLPMGVLGATINSFESHAYGDVKFALTGDATSLADLDSLSLHQDGMFVEAMVNVPGTTAPVRIGSSMGPSGESAWNSVLKVTRANSRALGLSVTDDGEVDIRIVINDDFIPLFDFDRSDGVDAAKLDFQTVIAHEIGHGMGFVSGVDTTDFEGPMGDGSGADLSDEAIFSILDLYRTNVDTRGMSDLPGDGGGFVLDWRYGPAPGPVSLPFFSLDTDLVDPMDKTPFSTGGFHGDGEQAGHWSDSFAIGLMNPDLDKGVFFDLSPSDISAFDVIGWNTGSVPEPCSAALLASFCLIATMRRRRAIG